MHWHKGFHDHSPQKTEHSHRPMIVRAFEDEMKQVAMAELYPPQGYLIGQKLKFLPIKSTIFESVLTILIVSGVRPNV